ncbi:hypothetical protein JXD38_11665 [candidate division WOR-3 bacterium]|nr:hypothetical protein [candidate division WOR-3 bacterium]
MKRLCLVALSLTSCLYFQDVYQPSLVSTGEHITITVSGTHDGSGGYSSQCWLAMMLPDGIHVDSVRYKTPDSIDGVVTEPDTVLGTWLQEQRPPDSGMCWIVFATEALTAESAGVFDAHVYLHVADTASPGSYLVDYLLGYWSATISDSILDQPLEVTATGIAEGRGCRGARESRVWPSLFSERVSIAVPEPDNVGVYDAGGRLVRNLRVEQTGFWDGTDERGLRVPAGAYLVRGEHVLGRVTLFD